MNNANVVYRKDKNSGSVYAYEDYPYWDSNKKQSRSKRKYLGKVDPSTGEVIPTKGRKPKKQEMKIKENPPPKIETEQVVEKALSFLQLTMSLTLAKRFLCIVLLAAGLTIARITKLVDLGEKSVQKLEKQLIAGDYKNLFQTDYTKSGRKRKLADAEEAIVAEINKNNYHSQQQIADMIENEYGIKVSLPVISRLLKKTESND